MSGSVQPDPTFWARRSRWWVTGGGGFLGKLGDACDPSALGAEVRVIRPVDYDLRVAERARAAVDGAEVVIHLAARVGGIGFNRRNPALYSPTTTRSWARTCSNSRGWRA